MIRRLLLWRHGRTEWNASSRFQGQADPGLDDVGLEQARAAAVVLAREQPDAIYTSDLRRASMTAQQLGGLTGVPVVETSALRETHLGSWQGLTRDEVAVQFADELRRWQAGEEVRRGNGELATEVAERAVDFVRQLEEAPDASASTVVLVAHGGTNKALTARLLDLDPSQWSRLSPLANCHWTELRRDAVDRWRLYSHNVGPLTAVPTRSEAVAEHTPNVDADPGEDGADPQAGGQRRAELTPAEVAAEYRYLQLRGKLPLDDAVDGAVVERPG